MDIPVDEFQVGKFKDRYESYDKACVSTNYLLALVAPFVIFLILYFTVPDIVIKREYDGKKIDKRKMIYWVLGLTIVVWIILYLISNSPYYKSDAEVCAKY